MRFLNYISNSILVLACVLTFISCGSGGDDTPPAPEAASLIFPEDNTECNEGTILSDTQSTVTFRWNDATNADSYDVTVTNLNSNSTQVESSDTNSADITILRGVPYSWSVTSKNASTETATSDTWRFYNAGLPVQNYAPFPANLTSPQSGIQVPAGQVTLEWEGNDIDNDITSFTVVLDTDNPPTTEVGNVSTSSFTATVDPASIYYWRITTVDREGNTSNSEISQFRTE